MAGRRWGVAAASLGSVVALLVIVMTGSPALAKGKHGPVSWGSLAPACTYSGQTLTQIRVNPPRVSMDKKLAKKGGRSQYVGVRVVLQGLRAGRWVKVAKRPKKRAYAVTVKVRPRKMKSLKHAKLMTFKGSALPAAYSSFRIATTLQWYAYNGHTIRGSLTRTSSACARIRPYATRIEAGSGDACALMSDRTMRCWGDGSHGRLGTGSTAARSRPTRVAGLTGVTSFSMGNGQGCAVVGVNGGVRCWGYNAYGQVGDGTTTDRTRPVAVRGVTSAARVFAGGDDTCAASLKAGSPLVCWGLNDYAQIGTGARSGAVTSATTASGVSYAVSADSGRTHTCAVRSGGIAWCWGSNAWGEITGTPSNPSSTLFAPHQMTGETGAAQIVVGGNHTCALVTNGVVRCWGANTVGQLGNRTSGNTGQTTVAGLPAASYLSAYLNTTCAIASGHVYCWGENTGGLLGVGDTTPRTTAVEVHGISRAVGVAVGASSTYAWDAAGHVWAWGDNSSGTFGNGSTTNSLTPVAVSVH